MTKHKEFVEEQIVRIGTYIAKTGATIREAATEFGFPKTTVHNYLIKRLPKQNPRLAEEVRAVLDKNKAERNFRGGSATKEKYKKIKEQQK